MEKCCERLKKAMSLRNLTQAELCQMTNIPKSAMSQYVSGKFMPKQTRIFLLAKALNVNEPWLMGLDVPMERIPEDERRKLNKMLDTANNYLENQLETDKNIEKYYGKGVRELLQYTQMLNDKGVMQLTVYADDLVSSGKYAKTSKISVENYTQSIAAGTGAEGMTKEKAKEVTDFAKRVYEIENKPD